MILNDHIPMISTAAPLIPGVFTGRVSRDALHASCQAPSKHLATSFVAVAS